MPYHVDFKNVSTTGLESSPVATAFAGLRANEARYFKNKYDQDFTVEPASEAKETIDWVHAHPQRRSAASSSQSRPLEATAFQVEGIRLGLRLLRERPVHQRDVHHRRSPRSGRSGSSSPRGWTSPPSSPSASSSRGRSRSWPGTIRGSFFVIKGEY